MTLLYASALILGLLAFALGAYGVLKTIERNSLDLQLRTASSALRAIAETRGTKIVLEHSDRTQFYEILGLRLSGAIVDASGAAILSNVANVPLALRSRAFVAEAPRIATLGAQDDSFRFASLPIEHGKRLGAVVVWRPIEWFAQLDAWLVLATLVTMLAIVVPAVAAGAFIAERGLRPLERIADVASEIEARDLALRLEDTGNARDELGRLSITFNRMLDRLQTAFDRERRFTADASHELRAPLAVIAAETELALRRDRSAQDYRAALQTVADVVREIETLIESLLSAARSESAATSGESIELAALVSLTLDRLAPLASSRSIGFVCDLQPGVNVFSERVALGRALSAVEHNALKFAPAGGTVRVAVSRDGDEALVRIGDDGPGFTQEGLENALERFWRADPARSPGTGSGLGLAIARSIVERAGGSIVLANSGGAGGALVTLRLPIYTTLTGV